METRFFRKLVQWIREEFDATPHLRLTTREAAAFLGLDLETSERVLTELLLAGFLARGADDRYRLLTATM
jgi:DNA-binding IclR family transcriptional regulator